MQRAYFWRIRVYDFALWDTAKELGQREGMSLSEIIQDGLRDYVEAATARLDRRDVVDAEEGRESKR